MSVAADPSPWCHAPSTALYFDPLGFVYPCCSSRQPLGRIGPGPGGSLRDIWHGPVREAVRAAVAAGDLPRGCADCAQAAESSGRGSSLAVHFDRWRSLVRDLPLDLEFALSNTCNLQCVMCNGMLSSAIRTQREHRPPLPAVYGDRFFGELAELLPGARRVAFKGGEPFLAREACRVMDLLIDQRSTAEITITTNATVWSERVERYLRVLRMAPIVSIDAVDPELLERVRVGVHADRLWENIGRIERVARGVGRPLTFSYCLMPDTYQELAPLLVEAESRGAFVAIAHVSQPLHQSLLGLDIDDLARIRSQMNAQEALFSDLLPENRATWNHALAWVDYCRERRGQVRREVGVDVRSGRADSPSMAVRSAPGDPSQDADLAELHRWSGAGAIVVQAVDGGIISEVSMPNWIDGLDVKVIGRQLGDLPLILAELVGEELEPRVDAVGHFAATNPAGEVIARAVVLGDDRRTQVHLALSPVARARVLDAGN